MKSRIDSRWFAIDACALSIFASKHLFAEPIAPAAPKYSVRVERSVLAPMRDGVKLSTDLYFPEAAEEKLPVILLRTPYDKKVEWTTGPARWLAGQGYIVAVQDVRGKFESQGEYIVSARDPQDGYDTIDRLASQPWSTGKVGTYGCQRQKHRPPLLRLPVSPPAARHSMMPWSARPSDAAAKLQPSQTRRATL